MSLAYKQEKNDERIHESLSWICEFMIKKAVDHIQIVSHTNVTNLIESWDWLLGGSINDTPFTFEYCLNYLNQERNTLSYMIPFVRKNYDSLISVLHTKGDVNKPRISLQGAQTAYEIIKKLK